MCILKNLTSRYVSSSRNAIVTHALCDWCLGVIINYETWKFGWVFIFADFGFILDPLKKVLRKITSCKNKTPEKLLPLVIKISAYWLNCTPCSIFTRNLHQRIIYSASRSLFRWYSELENFSAEISFISNQHDFAPLTKTPARFPHHKVNFPRSSIPVSSMFSILSQPYIF